MIRIRTGSYTEPSPGDLHHTCATLLFGEKQHPKDVQLLLGHANVRMTLDTYSHAIPGGGALTAAAMERALAPQEPDGELDEDA